MTERHHFFHKKRAISLLSQEGATSFLCMGRCKSLGSFKTFFDMHLNYLGPFFLHPESPQGAPLGAVAAADGLMDLTSFVHWYSLTFIVHRMHTATSTEEVLGRENSSHQYRERRLKSRRKEPGKQGFLWEQTSSSLGWEPKRDSENQNDKGKT